MDNIEIIIGGYGVRWGEVATVKYKRFEGAE